MKRYRPPSLLQALNMILRVHQELEGICRNLDAEVAKAKEASKTLDDAINSIKGYNLRDSDYMPLHESMVAIRSAANVIRKTVRRQASGIDYLKMAANLIDARHEHSRPSTLAAHSGHEGKAPHRRSEIYVEPSIGK